jgi:hypothetical protein
MTELSPDFSLEEVAEALKMSPRWVRDRVREGAEHRRYGQKIRFSAEQVERLREAHTRAPAAASLTTGRKKRSA